MTAEMTASMSLRLKYQCPVLEGRKLEISPWIVILGNPSSSVALMRDVISRTE
jgi:hypothetical protein